MALKFKIKSTSFYDIGGPLTQFYPFLESLSSTPHSEPGASTILPSQPYLQYPSHFPCLAHDTPRPGMFFSSHGFLLSTLLSCPSLSEWAPVTMDFLFQISFRTFLHAVLCSQNALSPPSLTHSYSSFPSYFNAPYPKKPPLMSPGPK